MAAPGDLSLLVTFYFKLTFSLTSVSPKTLESLDERFLQCMCLIYGSRQVSGEIPHKPKQLITSS